MTRKFLTSVAAAAIAVSMSPALAQNASQDQLQVPAAEDRANELPLTGQPISAEPSTEPLLAEESMPADQVQTDTSLDAEDLDPSGKFVLQQQEEHWLTSSLIGQDVNSPDGETIGQVVALEIGPDQKITAVVIDAGGFLGLGAKRVAVPFKSVERTQPEDGDQYLVADLTRPEIETAPEYMTLEEKRQSEERASAGPESGTTSPLEPAPATAE